VRQFITSGTAEEQVPDKSIFCRQFLLAIDGDGDVDHDGYVTGTELGDFLQKSVTSYSRETQHPQFGKIRNVNLDKGDFLFLNRATRESPPVVKQPETPPKPAPQPTAPVKSAKPVVQPAPPVKTPKMDPQPAPKAEIPQPAPPVKPPKPKPECGELQIMSDNKGDLFIDELLYQTVVPNTWTTLYNIPVGKHKLVFKGEKTFESDVNIMKDLPATVVIHSKAGK